MAMGSQCSTIQSRFRIRQCATAPTGIIDGLSVDNVTKLDPDTLMILIDDLLKVKANLENDPDWKSRVSSDPHTLAEWRKESISVITDYASRYLEVRGVPLDVIIFARGHDPKTLADLILGDIPRVYLSYHITGIPENLVGQIAVVKEKLKNQFVCIDPYTIKDWDIVHAYDLALETESREVEIPGFGKLPLHEVEEAIDEIRSQVVLRDHLLIDGTHATFVCHFSDKPSYGVMDEIIHTRTEADNPIYVLYPFAGRPSPFFEFYVERNDRIIRGSANQLDQMTGQLAEKALADIRNDMWPKWKSPLKK